MDNISIDSPAPVVSEEMQKLVRALTTAIEDGATKRAIDVAHHSLLLAISKIESPSSFVDTGIPENIAEGIAHCRTWYDPTYERISEKECVVFLADRVATLEQNIDSFVECVRVRDERIVALEQDKKRLDYVESQTNGMFWCSRQSTTGRGYRLHNSVFSPSYKTARAAIDAAMSPVQDVSNG